jgi:DNA-binding GntR family transcriptional regulator
MDSTDRTMQRQAPGPLQRPSRSNYDTGRFGDLVAATLPHYDTLQEGVIETLRRAIMLDILPVGLRLRQEDLAGVFRTSRIPIREALRALEYEGLVRSEPHRGFEVAGLDGEQVEEIYELRTILEEHALRLAIPLLTDRDLDELDARFTAMETAIHGDSPLEAAIDALEAFYLRLYAVTAKPRLVRLINRLRQESVRSFRTWQVRPSLSHHRAFYEAVRDGDVEMAATQLRTHYVRVSALLRRFLREAGTQHQTLPDGYATLAGSDAPRGGLEVPGGDVDGRPAHADGHADGAADPPASEARA